MKWVTSSFSALSDISVLGKPYPHFFCHFSGLWLTGDTRFLRVLDEVRVVSPKSFIFSMETPTISVCQFWSFWPLRQGVGQLLGAPHVGFFSSPSLQEIAIELAHCSRKVFKSHMSITGPTVLNVQLSLDKRFPQKSQ